MNKNKAHRSLLTLVLIATTLLSACGFQLRGNYLLPQELQTLYLSSTDTHGELTRLVKQNLQVNNVEVLKQQRNDTPELRILNDSLDRRTLSLFENGQVAEYELTYTVRYEIRMQGKENQDFTFEIYRNYQDNPDQALAKSRELTLLRKEMRIEAADRILRNMASITL
ncbi:LPS-assembly lipoprotein LptE [Thalassotalea litorea]|uniref:LPS-assembly lipoprotein LptE n=1 Tax=Thalassotalea litorea TaxID=2020715 RepID=UPI0037353F66